MPKKYVGNLYQNREHGGIYLVVDYYPHPYNAGSVDLESVDSPHGIRYNTTIDQLKEHFKKVG